MFPDADTAVFIQTDVLHGCGPFRTASLVGAEPAAAEAAETVRRVHEWRLPGAEGTREGLGGRPGHGVVWSERPRYRTALSPQDSSMLPP